MDTQTWHTLSLPENERGHPVLLALLYVFCPAAAGWWRAGAEPVLCFDPLYEAHIRRARGETLRAVLEDWGFGGMIGRARGYVEQVRAFREKAAHARVTAPELLPTFKPGKLPISLRHRHAAAVEQIDGWANFYRFVRAWAFTAEDWKTGMSLERPPAVRPARLVFPEICEQPLQFHSWTPDSDTRAAAVLVPLKQAGMPLLEALIAAAEFPGAAGPVSAVYRWHEDGRTARIRPRFDLDSLRQAIDRLATPVQAGALLPIQAYRNPAVCLRCGFTALCWEAGEIAGRLTPQAATGI